MDEKEIQAMVAKAAAEAAAEALKADREAREEAQKLADAKQAEIDAAVKAAMDARDAAEAVKGRLPQAINVNKIEDDARYSHLDAGDIALMASALKAHGKPVSTDAYRNMAIKLTSEEEQRREPGREALKAIQRTVGPAIKTDEIENSTLASYGNEWAGVLYSGNLWNKIRQDSVVIAKLPSVEVPQGYESMSIPIEGTDPTFYHVAQAADLPTTEATGIPNATITTSQVETPTPRSLTVAKLGARVLWTGEMEEDSLVPWMPQLRAQLNAAAMEQLEHVIIDGDTATGGTTNINDIGGTPVTGRAYLAIDGLRKLALVTNTANSVSVGTLTVEDFLTIIKLMGAAGKNANPQSVSFIVDPNTWYKIFELDEFKTRDVYSNPTLERGMIPSPWGYPIMRSFSMHWWSRGFAGYEYKAQAADGKIDEDTQSDNAAGAILAVRWDQWLMGWKRRMTMETTRIARADVTEIVVMLRMGLTYRDTEASAIGYGVTL